MTVVVLGATGLVGRHVVEALARDADDAIVATSHRRPGYDAPRTRWASCDLGQPGAATAVLQGASAAVLCAGQLATSSTLKIDPVSPITDTLRIATNVLESAAAVRLPKLVLVSSCTVYPSVPGHHAREDDAMRADPPDQWFGVGWMHRYVEQQLRWYVERLQRIGTAVVLRPTLVYGRYGDFSRQTGHFVPTLVAKVVERERPIEVWGDGEQTRNLMHGADLARAVLAARSAALPAFSAFNVTSPRDSSVNEVLRALLDIDGFADADIRHDLAKSTGPSSLQVAGDAFRAATGWEATTSLRDGLADAVDWYRAIRKA